MSKSYMDKMREKIQKQQGNIAINSAEVKEDSNIVNDSENKTESYEDIPNSIEEIEKEILTLTQRMWDVAWYIGKRLEIIRDKHLDSTGYKNIELYAKDKFKLSKYLTYQFINIASRYDLVCARKHGSKLRLLQSIKDENKEKEILSWMNEKEPSFREIQKKVNEVKDLNIVNDKNLDIKPKESIIISKNRIAIDYNKMGLHLNENMFLELKKELEEVLKKYSI